LLDGKPWKGNITPTVLLQASIEVFDTILRYLSNTISFIRLAAFAVSHGAMGAVVIALAASLSSYPLASAFGITLGNIFVLGLEGLIVFVQALRLNYYELFTKFFAADGVAFRPFILLAPPRG